MSNIKQIIQNFYLRLVGLLSVVFGTLFGSLARVFGSIGKILGISQSDYFFEESNKAEEIKSAKTTPVTVTKPVEIPEVKATTRRPNAKMDNYFLDMAKQVQKK
ncbi:MAG: threonine dehydratase [Rhizonema sp. PD38]|nr:threonine dehydratase [Rhizonema sp. PD38]